VRTQDVCVAEWCCRHEVFVWGRNRMHSGSLMMVLKKGIQHLAVYVELYFWASNRFCITPLYICEYYSSTVAQSFCTHW